MLRQSQYPYENKEQLCELHKNFAAYSRDWGKKSEVSNLTKKAIMLDEYLPKWDLSFDFKQDHSSRKAMLQGLRVHYDELLRLEKIYAKRSPQNFVKRACGNHGCHNCSHKQCTRCKQVSYCSRNCQIAHWRSEHKYICEKPEQKTSSKK